MNGVGPEHVSITDAAATIALDGVDDAYDDTHHRMCPHRQPIERRYDPPHTSTKTIPTATERDPTRR
jgi:hypothetical protein